MKKLFLILSIMTFVACKSDKQVPVEVVEENTNYKEFSGLYLFHDDAAILQTTTEVYGVVIDEQTQVLNTKVKQYKVLDTDMIPVEIKGELIPKPKGEEGWPFSIKIKEIVKVSKPISENKDIITLGK